MKRFFKHITPKFTVGIDPMKDFVVSFDWEEVVRSPDEILNLPESISGDSKRPVNISAIPWLR
ncbi:MAG TPA: hypothetical protein VGR15_03655 [Bacteroidota bacterium]|nr:hypothetical protein [Bacteroidota bacterium]